VTIETNGKPQMAEVLSGGSYYSQNELPLYFGLGPSTQIDKIEVRWPLGKIDVFRNVAANRTIRYVEAQK
jgi:hypothetical protein